MTYIAAGLLFPWTVEHVDKFAPNWIEHCDTERMKNFVLYNMNVNAGPHAD